MAKKPVVRIATDSRVISIDGYANLASRIGTPGDKSYFGRYVFQPLDQSDLEGAYRTSWLGKIIDIKAEDTFREWRTWQGDKDQISKIEGLETSLNLRGAYLEADRLAMIYGGAAVFLGGLPGALSMPVNLDAVKQDSLKYVTVMDRWDVTVGEMETDPTTREYGLPRYYNLGSERVHPSRVVRFIGRQKPNMRREWDGWGDPLWAGLREAVRNTDAITAGISALVQEAKLDVISIPGLSQKISTREFEDILVKRFNTQLMLKSIINALLLDGGNGDGKTGEIHTTKTQTFAGLPDITDRFLMILCAMADVPATRLLGRAPQGMNSTGESDEKNYAVMVKARQDLKITPVTRFADEIVVRSALGMMPTGMWYDWNPLAVTSEKDAATVEKTYADAFVARMGTGAIDDTVLAKSELNRMIETGRYPGIEEAIKDSENEDGLVDPDEKEAKELARMQAEAEIAAAGNPGPVA
jgi:phage-related protein (TIGR01555 family)